MTFSCACSHSEDIDPPVEESPNIDSSGVDTISFENLGAPIDSIADLKGYVWYDARHTQKRWTIGYHIPGTIDCVDLYFPAEFPKEYMIDGLPVIISGIVYEADDIHINMGGYTSYKIKLTKIEKEQ